MSLNSSIEKNTGFVLIPGCTTNVIYSSLALNSTKFCTYKQLNSDQKQEKDSRCPMEYTLYCISALLKFQLTQLKLFVEKELVIVKRVSNDLFSPSSLGVLKLTLMHIFKSFNVLQNTCPLPNPKTNHHVNFE